MRRAAARSIGQIAQIVQTNEEKVLTPENFLPDKYKDLKQPKYLDLKNEFPIFNQAANVLKTVLQNKNETDDTRREAAFSLGAIGDESAVSILQTKLKDKDYYLAEIAEEALRKIEFLQMLRKRFQLIIYGINFVFADIFVLIKLCRHYKLKKPHRRI